MKRKIFSILFTLVLVLSFSLVTAAPVGANTDRLVPSTYITIQAAINAAGSGDTIIVDVAYNSNNETFPITVNVANLTIQAATGTSPVIDGGGNLGPGVHITAADVTFQDFTVTNFTCTPASGIGAILVEGDGAVIDDNIIYDILPQGDPINDPAGIGIDVHASNVEVTNNVVHDVGSIGIRVRYDWDTAPTVSNNVLLENNEVYRTGNTGVLVTGYAKGVTIKNNEIYESLEPTPYSLFVHYGAEDVLIEDNNIHDPYDSIYGHNVVLAGCDNVTISGNAITGATSGKSIYLLSDYSPWVDANLLSTNVNIINNDIQNGKWGVRLVNAGAADASNMAATTTINFNNISGNTDYGVENTIATNVDATNNWWDDASGPGGVGPGTGDAVSNNVDYSPWLGASIAAATTGETPPNTVDATPEIDAEVITTGTGTPTITILEYDTNPGTGFSGDIGKYIDVHIDDTSGVTEIEIRLYYTNREIRGLAESSLRLYWWDGSAWTECSDSGVNPADTNGYSGYIWAKIRVDTIPDLDDLTGTPFGGGGNPRIVGGTVLPVDKVSILMPWIGLAVALALAGVFIARFARRKVRG